MPESQWFERKSTRVAQKALAAAIIGMANAEGGSVVVGLSEGRVEGVDSDLKQVNRLRRVPLELIEPPILMRIDEVEVVNDRQEEDHVLLFVVSPSQHAHQRTDGEAFVRAGDSTIRLSRSAWQELVYDREADSYEAQPAPAGTDAVDGAHVFRLQEAIGAEGDVLHVLRARSLVTADDRLNIAGLLLLADRPQRYLPQAVVRVLRYQSDEVGEGSRQTMVADGDRRLEGPIPTMLDAATALVDQWAPRRRALRPDGRFGSIDVIPREAWLEAVVNAVIHRSYSMAGDHIRVSIFPHRIEVSSPGRFPGFVSPDRPLEVARYARNPRIARVCADLGYAQELGEGIRRMVGMMRQSGLADPLYQQTATSVILRLDAATRIAGLDPEGLGKEAAEIVALLRSVGPLGTSDIASAIGVSRQTVLKRLKSLREQGVVERRGHSPQDPRATWVVQRS
ncbi:MAG: ATP-binding protein [Actinomyces sp.]|uniref:ATP-binding protein n=1 Tax=Actinomyces sp. TaxID=29317 RepID=UPI0026DCAA61|nr:ATP-binding protein [Actinomyces sp.]MDO4242823.1 ATP-binding protein [Actinomyces sp.]